MAGGASGGVVDLMTARHARRGDVRLGRGGADGWSQRPLGHGDGDVVVLVFVAERARHATAAGIDDLHRVAGQRQRLHRRPGADDKVADRAWDLIRAARRPIIVAGNGTIRKRASRQLRAFCDATGIGVVSTFMGKGCVDRHADYCLFTIGLQQKDYVALAVDDADLVITLGYDLVEYPPRVWNPDGSKPIVHLDFLPAEIDRQYMPQVEMIGDLAHGLWMLNQRVARDGRPDFDLTYQRRVRARMLEDFATHAEDDTVGSIRPQKVLWDVRQAMGPAGASCG